MTTAEFYDRAGGDFNGMLCLLCSEQKIIKFLRMFRDDRSYNDFCKYMEANDWKNALSAVHTLKGVALNLCLTSLAAAAAAVVQPLKCGDFALAAEEKPRLDCCYSNTINLLNALLDRDERKQEDTYGT